MVKIRTCQQIRSSPKQCLSDYYRLSQTYQHQQPNLLAGIALPKIRRKTANRGERLCQSTYPRQPLFRSVPAPTRLKSRRSFLSHFQPKAEINMERWIDKLKSNPPSVDMGIQPSESLPPGSNAPWPTWKTLNRFRSSVGRTKANLIKWEYHTGDPSCNCGTEIQTMEHQLQCPLLKTPCYRDDLSIFKTLHRNA